MDLWGVNEIKKHLKGLSLFKVASLGESPHLILCMQYELQTAVIIFHLIRPGGVPYYDNIK